MTDQVPVILSEREQWECMEDVEVTRVPEAEIDQDCLYGLWPVPAEGALRVEDDSHDLIYPFCLECGEMIEPAQVRRVQQDGYRFYYGWAEGGLHWLGQR